jgi:general secretion pathway protein N
VTGSSRLIKAGLLVFVIALVVSFPARVAYRWFAPAEFVASGISGSIWSGRAAEASAAGNYFRDLNWNIRLLDLLTAKLGYAVESKLSSGFVEGNIAVGFGGTLRATDVRATLPLASLQSVSGIAGMRGSATANFSRLEFVNGMPKSAQGVVEISGLTVPLVSSDPIGGFKAEFFSQESGIAGSLEDTNAVIDLAGSLQLTADGGYQLVAQLSATDQTPAAIRQQLQFLGPANDRGQHELRLEGKL